MRQGEEHTSTTHTSPISSFNILCCVTLFWLCCTWVVKIRYLLYADEASSGSKQQPWTALHTFPPLQMHPFGWKKKKK